MRRDYRVVYFTDRKLLAKQAALHVAEQQLGPTFAFGTVHVGQNTAMSLQTHTAQQTHACLSMVKHALRARAHAYKMDTLLQP
jgi:hypothetical protein